MKKFLFAVLLLFSFPAAAGNFCSYSSGAPIVGTDIFLLTETGCAASGTKQGLASDIKAYVDNLEISSKTADYTLVLTDQGDHIKFNSTGNVSLTVPLNSTVAFDTGEQIWFSMFGGGTLTVAFASTGITSFGSVSFASKSGKLLKTNTDEWIVEGGS